MRVCEGVEWDKTAMDINEAVRLLRQIRQDIAEVEAFAAARKEQLEAQQATLWEEWGDAFRQMLAQSQSADPEKKSIQFPGGVIQQRTYAPKLKVTSSTSAVAWAEENAPWALVTMFDGTSLGTFHGEKVVTSDGVVVVDPENGVSIPGVELVPSRTVLYIQSTRRSTSDR